MGDAVVIAAERRVWRTAHRAGLIAWSLQLACLAAWLVIVWQVAHPSPQRVPLGWGVWTLAFVAVGFFATLLGVVGAVIVSRRARNVIGWLNVAAGVGLTLGCLGLVAGSQLLLDRALGPSVQLFAFVSAAALQASVAAIALVPLWFPNGPQSAGRFAFVAVLIPIAVAVRFLELFFQKGPDWLFPLYPSAGAPANPYEIGGLPGAIWDLDHLIGLGFWLSVACVVLTTIAVAQRLRSSSGVERQQLQWFAGAVLLVVPPAGGIVYTLLALKPDTSDADAIVAAFYFSLALPTVATLIAITRYRLYEIDRLVNRALVYGSVTAILAGLFAGLISFSERLFTAVLGTSSDAAIALTAVVVTAAYTPVREHVQRLVDGRVRYLDPRFGPYRDTLNNALETMDPRLAVGRLVREAASQMRAVAAAAYLELDGSLRLSATTGDWDAADVTATVPIGLGSNRLGELRLARRIGDRPYGVHDLESLTSIADLAAQAIIAAQSASIERREGRLNWSREIAPP